MNQFLLFSGDYYYPSGGWDDFVASYKTVQEARAADCWGDWAQVVDSVTGEVVSVGTYSRGAGWTWEVIV